MTPPTSVEAAVAVIQREDGHVLLGQRPSGKPWAGWWEFPGGKIEDGETPLHALQRELHEELDIAATHVYPWVTRSFDYPERRVMLRFFRVRDWTGEPHGKEGQQLSWQDPAALTVSPMLPANTPLLAALSLPPVYAVSHLRDMGEQAFFAALDAALRQGLRLVQVREKQLHRDDLAQFTQRVIARCRPCGARVVVNGDADLARVCGADGVHLPAAALMRLAERPQGMLAGASCHGIDELQHAVALDLDFVVLSPVLPTRSHPETPPLGWERFAALIAGCPLPVYALGGLQPAHLETAWRHGAHGIAMQRAVWGC